MCPVGTCRRRWQSDPKVGSETSGGRGQRPPRRLSDRGLAAPPNLPTAGAGAGPGGIRHLLPQAAFLASEGRSKRLRATCRCSPAPMARAVGTATRLPRQERAHDGYILGYTVPNATRHAIPHHNAHIYPRIYRATHRHKPPPPAPSRVSRILWTRETLTCSGAGAAPPPMAHSGAGAAPPPHGASGGRGHPPTPAPSRVFCSLRSLATLTAAHPAPICVRRKGGPCHSERRAGMGPARKRAATKRIPRTA